MPMIPSSTYNRLPSASPRTTGYKRYTDGDDDDLSVTASSHRYPSYRPSTYPTSGTSSTPHYTTPSSVLSSLSGGYAPTAFSSRLPPRVPSTYQSINPSRPATSRRPPSYTSAIIGLDDDDDDDDDYRTSTRFQSGPSRNVTPLIRSPSPSYRNGYGKSDARRMTNDDSDDEDVDYKPTARYERPPASSSSQRDVRLTPRRTYPQEAARVDRSSDAYGKGEDDDAPVVFDANLTFVLGTKGKMKHNFKPTPAHKEAATASNCLTTKIADFLQRTDHVMDEWKTIGRNKGRNGDDSCAVSGRRRASPTSSVGRSKSSTNIMIKGFQLFSRASSCRSASAIRDASEDGTEADGEELSEMTADLAEEQSTSTMATAKLDVEASERKRLQRDLNDVQERNKTLEENSQRLELELLTAKSDLNGISEEPNETSGTDSDDGVYKKRFERATKELEFTKKRLQQQHEDDLEQLIGLKKQLEKKLTDAYEEVEEQRQVVSQWKRKVQKLNGEMNDLKVLLEEQNARNNVLEKKQRKFDAEMQMIHDELKQERSQKDRLQREKDVLAAEKFALEGTLADVRLELELKEERLTALQVDYDELTYGGKTEEEVTILRRQKIDCERRLHDQHEELDDLAGQVQLLEQTKLKLEMALEQQRKSAKRETQQHEDEMEDVRSNAQKKIKALESQLENEHEERTLLVKEKHELERRLIEIMEADRNEKACDEALFHRLKRDLKRTKALLKDTQAQLERVTSENPSKSVVRQLKNQLEDVECARNVALKAKQHLENELLETQNQLEDVVKQKTDAEEKMNACVKERCELQAQVEENEEEMAEMLKKYKTAVQQMSMDQAALQEQVCLVTELEMERNKLREQLNELTLKLENAESVGGASSHMILKKGELKLKELESKLELEQTTRSRLEVQMARLKDAMEKLQIDLNNSRIREHASQETTRKLQRTLRELKEELNGTAAKETETLQKRKEMEKKYEALEGETVTLRQDLKVALKRIADLQAAIQGELEDSVSDHSDSEKENYSSDESVNTFLLNHKPPSSSNNNNGGINRSTSDSGRRSSNTSRSSTSSFLGNS